MNSVEFMPDVFNGIYTRQFRWCSEAVYPFFQVESLGYSGYIFRIVIRCVVGEGNVSARNGTNVL